MYNCGTGRFHSRSTTKWIGGCQYYLEELASSEVEHELGIKAEVLRQSEALRRILVELAKLLAQPKFGIRRACKSCESYLISILSTHLGTSAPSSVASALHAAILM